MFEADINLWAVLAAATAYFLVGALWYMVLFAKPWMEAAGMTKEDTDEGGGSAYLMSFILFLLLSYVLAHILVSLGVATLAESIATGIWLWVGFVATTMTVNFLYSGKSRKLLVIDATYHLAGILAAAATLHFWL
ncbi:MAG: DUF1761 domain-containing protein [Candidatus Saccharimonadales bacterium]